MHILCHNKSIHVPLFSLHLRTYHHVLNYLFPLWLMWIRPIQCCRSITSTQETLSLKSSFHPYLNVLNVYIIFKVSMNILYIFHRAFNLDTFIMKYQELVKAIYLPVIYASIGFSEQNILNSYVIKMTSKIPHDVSISYTLY